MTSVNGSYGSNLPNLEKVKNRLASIFEDSNNFSFSHAVTYTANFAESDIDFLLGEIRSVVLFGGPNSVPSNVKYLIRFLESFNVCK